LKKRFFCLLVFGPIGGKLALYRSCSALLWSRCHK
jgi:hypothetical protein